MWDVWDSQERKLVDTMGAGFLRFYPPVQGLMGRTNKRKKGLLPLLQTWVPLHCFTLDLGFTRSVVGDKEEKKGGRLKELVPRPSRMTGLQNHPVRWRVVKVARSLTDKDGSITYLIESLSDLPQQPPSLSALEFCISQKGLCTTLRLGSFDLRHL